MSGGGGISLVWPTPPWQTGYGIPTSDPGTPNGHHRYLPDVSLSAAGHDAYAVGISKDNRYSLAAGTSAAAPAFAGIMAIVNQVTNQANGNPNPRLYGLATEVPSVFHDITTGSNAVPCMAGSPDCSGGILTGYSAGPGYDLATGWGSVDAYVLAHAWAVSTPAPVPLNITSSSPLTGGQTGTAYVQTLTATGGTPPYSWTVNSGTLPSGLALSAAGAFSGTPTTPGTYSFTVQVTDSANATVSQTFQITITGSTSAGGMSPTANTYHVFPQFADGVLSDGSFYRTTLMISNPSATAAVSCTLQLRGLSVPGFNLTYSMGANGWIIASTSGIQSFQSGYATLQCSSSVESQLLYSYYDASGAKLSEATVFSSPPATRVQVLGDNRGGAQIAIAIANDSDQSGIYTIAAYDSDGNLVGSVNKTFAARSSYAAFVNDLVSLPTGYYGQILVFGNNPNSLIGLRYTGNVFTTIPGVVRSSVASTANTYHVFPQFADGQLSDGSYYHTTVLLTNPSSSSGSCALHLYGLSVNGKNVFTYSNVVPGSWAATTSISSMQSIKSGYATLSCSMPVEAQLLYSYYSSTGIRSPRRRSFLHRLHQAHGY